MRDPASAGAGMRTWHGHGMTVWYWPRAAGRAAAGDSLPLLMLGDDAEWDPREPDRNLAGGVPLWHDPALGLVAPTSLVGLPPLFVYEGPGGVAVTSDLHLLAACPAIDLALDPAGVVELGRVGHPVDHRTLFRNVRMAPAARRLVLGHSGSVGLTRTWELPDAEPLTWPEFIEAQIAAFTDAVRRTDLAGSFLSLTAGLDTRTVFAALADGQRLLPAATMSGPRLSLDARIAARLCRAYGIRHELVTFDQRFTDRLPAFVEQASRLSGGLAPFGQAPEAYLYDQVGDGWRGRLSGNLGNQVGRGGTEGVSTRGADLTILHADVRAAGGTAEGHWLLGHLGGDLRSATQVILEREIAFTSCGNYGVGNHFAIQQSPYADRALIETLGRRPRAGASDPSGSKLRMRLRDLKHRFLGEPAEVSFQRALVSRIGGFAAACPINWGWKAQGGVSVPGAILGAATLAGMVARAKGLDAGLLRAPLAWTGLPALHDFREARRWLRHDLREFVSDTIRSATVRASGLFDPPALERMLTEHFGGRRDHYASVTFAIDVALAYRLFCQAD